MLTSEKIINWVINSNKSKDDLIDYLENVENELAEALDNKEIDQETFDNRQIHIVKKAKEILKI